MLGSKSDEVRFSILFSIEKYDDNARKKIGADRSELRLYRIELGVNSIR
jgi:hypothetical protein